MVFVGVVDRFDAAPDAEFSVDVAAVMLDSPGAHGQRGGDLFVGVATCDESEHGDFPWGQH